MGGDVMQQYYRHALGAMRIMYFPKNLYALSDPVFIKSNQSSSTPFAVTQLHRPSLALRARSGLHLVTDRLFPLESPAVFLPEHFHRANTPIKLVTHRRLKKRGVRGAAAPRHFFTYLDTECKWSIGSPARPPGRFLVEVVAFATQ